MANQSTTATTGSTSEQREHRQERADKTQIVVVDLGQRQSRKQISRLRKGRGKLMSRIETILHELAEAGTVKASAQPVVFVVREELSLPWPFD
jgi:hypothetical protein